MNAAERRIRLKVLGYRLIRNYFCPIRHRKMPYATVPDNTPGTTCVHESLASVDHRIEIAEKVRRWQQEVIEETQREEKS